MFGIIIIIIIVKTLTIERPRPPLRQIEQHQLLLLLLQYLPDESFEWKRRSVREKGECSNECAGGFAIIFSLVVVVDRINRRPIRQPTQTIVIWTHEPNQWTKPSRIILLHYYLLKLSTTLFFSLTLSLPLINSFIFDLFPIAKISISII